MSALREAIRAVLDAPRSPDAPVPIAALDRLHTLVLGCPARDAEVLARFDDLATADYSMGCEDEREACALEAEKEYATCDRSGASARQHIKWAAKHIRQRG